VTCVFASGGAISSTIRAALALPTRPYKSVSQPGQIDCFV
ncbi:MAG: hypothetical protein ACI9Y1_002329, partial [Lentisphaeria bacterium]